MTVSDERPGLADLGRDITSGDNAVSPANRPVPLAPPVGVDDLARYLHALRRLADADDLAAAHSGCTLAVDVAGRHGSASGLAMAYSLRSSVARRMGRLPDAARDAEASAELLAVSGADPAGPAAALVLARRLAVLLDLGDVGDLELADGLLAETELAGDLPDDPEYLLLRYVRGRLHTATARPGEGLADLYRCGERLAVRRSDHPGVLPWRSAAASVLVGLGAREAAERLVAEEVALTRRHGLASALGRALRIQGQVRPGAAGMVAAEEAIRVLQGTPRRFELATALVDLGALLNAARRRPQARRVLRDGLELAQECGSPALVARARSLFAGRNHP
jgi:tetratricopeptide (TPR) repeat protein